MQLKKGLDVTSDDFWYDLTDGGYLDPHEICETKEDADIILASIEIIKSFERACEEQIEGFEQ